MRTRRTSESQFEILFSAGEETPESPGTVETPETALRALGVVLEPGGGREFVYTDKGRTRWTGETHGSNTSAYHGLTCAMHKVVEDWVLALGETRIVPSAAGRVVVEPHQLVRRYEFENTREETFFCDGTGVLSVVYTTGFRGAFRFVPRFDIRHIWDADRVAYRMEWRSEHNLLLLSNPALDPAAGPRWVGVTSSEPLTFTHGTGHDEIVYPQDDRRGVMGTAFPYRAGVLKGRVRSGRVVFLFVPGDSEAEIRAAVRETLFHRQECKLRRAERLGAPARAAVRDTGDACLENALRWAAVSLDGLVMCQQGAGLYAGLPWFPNYWSRDTFISMPALLAVSASETCREILRTALAGQCRDYDTNVYGRLPNLVSPGEAVKYNTADGTWWFVRALHRYVCATGDAAFAREAMPGLIRAMEGELRKRTDAEGFSLHGDAETWMDAERDGRAWSPRGDRAVEVQALWYGALRAAAEIGEWCDERGLAGEWRAHADRLRDAFEKRFWDREGRRLFDHLDPDGSPDRKVRPNQIFALLASPEPLLSFEQEAAVLDEVLDRLVFAHGVATLPPDDPDFHPRHVDPERYPFDEAYHNGDVWVWLSGPVVSALIRHGRTETAWAVFRSLVAQVHGEGAVGTLPELRNAVPPDEGPNWEGTVSQAWSLAEFLRPLWEDILGLYPRLLENRLVIEPAIPAALPSVRFDRHFGDVELRGEYRLAGPRKRFAFDVRGVRAPLTLVLHLRVPGGHRLTTEWTVGATGSVEFTLLQDPSGRWTILRDGTPAEFRTEETSFDIGREPPAEFRVPSERSV